MKTRSKRAKTRRAERRAGKIVAFVKKDETQPQPKPVFVGGGKYLTVKIWRDKKKVTFQVVRQKERTWEFKSAKGFFLKSCDSPDLPPDVSWEGVFLRGLYVRLDHEKPSRLFPSIAAAKKYIGLFIAAVMEVNAKREKNGAPLEGKIGGETFFSFGDPVGTYGGASTVTDVSTADTSIRESLRMSPAIVTRLAPEQKQKDIVADIYVLSEAAKILRPDVLRFETQASSSERAGELRARIAVSTAIVRLAEKVCVTPGGSKDIASGEKKQLDTGR